MRVALITPCYREGVRGNAVTVLRLEKYLRQQGCDLSVFSLDEASTDRVVSSVIAGRFDLSHAFHGYLGGSIARAINTQGRMPFIITLTGSDIYEAMADRRHDETLANLTSASAVVAFHEVVAARLGAEQPSIAQRMTVIPQGVELPELTHKLAAGQPGDEIVFLLPAGIRPVKDLISVLPTLAELHELHPELRLRLAGPVLDQEYAAQLFDMLPDFPFAEYLGVVDHQEMGELYRNAAVVLNSSRFEGGMANSLLEGMAWGRPLLASDVEGNRSLVKEGVNGFLYRDVSELAVKAELLLTDPILRCRLGMAGRRMAEENHSPEQEALAYLRLYEQALRRANSDSTQS
ncbi:glycosyltransferase 1 domain-containing protein 1 [Geobacter sp. OR-1]|uniref:glycosyltransferase n=1 Tax=Geobacter sp. OR-1 TaxID=1266765 RepID=UPI00054280F0|nr:glycosyltransferase [Geobacter sp. OR-1]GAM11171.1 glycosyltransferase 1 domain-containing protein 1 [Geobacter sp. OR-1]